MSVEIYYGRNFIKVGDKYIPLILHGSSNCTEFVNGREVLERNWSTICLDFLCTEKEMMDRIDSFEDPYGEWFRKGSRGGQWVDKEGFKKICKNACKDAHTIEEYVENRNHGLSIKACKWEEHSFISKNRAFIKTTQELLDWYDNFNKELKDEGYTIWAEFNTREQIKFPKMNPAAFPCVIRCGKSYLIDENGYQGKYNTWCANKKKALVINNQEELNNIKQNLVPLGSKTVTTENATIKVKPYVILYDLGGWSRYVKKKSSSHIFFTEDRDYAIEFSTEKGAQKYIDKFDESNRSRAKVVRIEG